MAALSIATHRDAGDGQTENARRLRDFCFRVDQPNKPAQAFLLDLLIPAAICGLIARLLLARWPRLLLVHLASNLAGDRNALADQPLLHRRPISGLVVASTSVTCGADGALA